jgi:hypothetical protein
MAPTNKSFDAILNTTVLPTIICQRNQALMFAQACFDSPLLYPTLACFAAKGAADVSRKKI